MKEFKEKKYRVTRVGDIYQPQVKWLFWWVNLHKAYMSYGEATRAINVHNAERKVRFNKQNK